jgi:hypothetical protein
MYSRAQEDAMAHARAFSGSRIALLLASIQRSFFRASLGLGALFGSRMGGATSAKGGPLSRPGTGGDRGVEGGRLARVKVEDDSDKESKYR